MKPANHTQQPILPFKRKQKSSHVSQRRLQAQLVLLLWSLALIFFLTRGHAQAQYVWSSYASFSATPPGIAVDSNGNVYGATNFYDDSTYGWQGGIEWARPGARGMLTGGTSNPFPDAVGLGQVAVDAGNNVYVADPSFSGRIWQVTPGGEVATLDFTAGLPSPYGVVIDGAGNTYVTSQNGLQKIAPNGFVTTLSGLFKSTQLAVDAAANVYTVVPEGVYGDTVQKITPDGTVTILAGAPTVIGSTDGAGSVARFHNPSAVAVDQNGKIYVADTSNHTIRMLTPDGNVTTIGGVPGERGQTEGANALFSSPYGVAVSNGILYVADANGRISKATLPIDPVSTCGLSALKLSAGALTPAFSVLETAYHLNVANSVASTTVSATKLTPKGSMRIEVNGKSFGALKSGKPSGVLPLEVGANSISIIVAEQEGPGETCTVTVNRVALPGAPIAIHGQAPAGTLNANFASLGLPAINTSDDIAFQAKIAGHNITGANNSGIWLQTGSNLASVLSTGSSTPYRVGSSIQTGVFTALSDPVLNNNAELAFLGTVKTGSGRTAVTSEGIWAAGQNGLRQMALMQSNLPDASGSLSGATIASFTQYVLTDQGRLAFLATLKVGTGGVKRTTDQGIWIVDADGQTTHFIAREGFPLETTAGTTPIVTKLSIFSTPASVGGQTRSFNADGEILFAATFADTTQGIFAVSPDAITIAPLLQNNDAPTNAGIGAFTAFDSPTLNNNGNAAFKAIASANGNAGSISGIWAEVGQESTPALVAQIGGSSSYCSGTTTVTGTFTALGDPVLNNNDQVGFVGTAKSGIGRNVPSYQGIWETGTTGELLLIAQAQQQAPDCASGAVFGAFDQLVLLDHGGAIFVANLAVGKGGVTSTNKQGLWMADGSGNTTLVARTGDVVVVNVNGKNTEKTIASLSIFTASTATAGQTRSFNPTTGDLIYRVTFTDSTQGIYEVAFL